MRKRTVAFILVLAVFSAGVVLLSNFFSSGIMITSAADAAMCKNNLKSIAQAKARWAQDQHKTTNDAPTWSDLVGTNHYLESIPHCPRGGVYNIGRVGEQPKCSDSQHSL